MSIYLDLQPSPQFDESLVNYCSINFERVRSLLRQARRRVTYENYGTAGPFAPKLINITVPYKCDMVVWAEITCYSGATGMMGMILTWDGAYFPIWNDMYFNEAMSHKCISSTNTFRNVTKGVHQFNQINANGNMTSDTGDRLRAMFTYYEL